MVKRLAFVLIATLAACGGSDDEPSVDAEGCEHLQEGPAAPITASADPAGAPAVDADHRRYDVALVDDGGGQYGGVVSFASAEATDYVLFLDAAVPVAFADAGGAPAAIEESATSSPECAEIRGRHVTELGVGTYYLTLGPTAATTVGIVIEEAAHDRAHE
jgi:hypothetical protein